MTRDEAIDVLRVLTAAWPNANLGDDTVELWITYLGTISVADGHGAASELVLSEQWMPPLAKFRQAVVDRRRRAAERASFGALPSGQHTATKDAALANLAAMRDMLRAPR